MASAKRIQPHAPVTQTLAASKLPGKSHGLSAWEGKTGRNLMKVPGSTCSRCYATKNFYATWNLVKVDHARRLAGLKDPRWVDAHGHAHHGRDLVPLARFGRLAGVWHLENIVVVAKRAPNTHHWLPTREYEMVQTFLEKAGEFPSTCACVCRPK